jgi:transposase
MTYSELEPEILRLYKVEKWPIGTIAQHFSVHHSVVERIVTHDHPIKVPQSRPSILEPYMGFIQSTIEKYPKIKGSRVFGMIKERGYPGKCPSRVCSYLRKIRPQKKKEAFFRLTSLPGEQAQVDWAHFGTLKTSASHSRKLYAFVMTLSHSRMVFLKFFLSSTSRDFYQGFSEAFEFFGGVPRQVWMDNLKSGVVSRLGPLVQFNENMLTLARHFSFEPVAMGVRRGNEKGKVERSIQYVRTSFFEARPFKDLADLNEQALEWCLKVAGSRNWQDDSSKSVIDVFTQEKEKLLSLPKNPWMARERLLVNVPKVPFVRFDLNQYSVPWKFAGSSIILEYDDVYIFFYKDGECIGEHMRSFGKGEVVEKKEHFNQLMEYKNRAKKHTGLDRLKSAVPVALEFVKILSDRGENPGGVVSSLLNMLEIYGRKNLDEAISEVVIQDSPRLKSLYFVLKRLDKSGDKTCSVPAQITLNSKTENLVVEYHSPKRYDEITGLNQK